MSFVEINVEAGYTPENNRKQTIESSHTKAEGRHRRTL